MEFPAFRSVEWINTTFNVDTVREDEGRTDPPPQFWVPSQILRGVEISPQYMKDTAASVLFKTRRLEVQQEIRKALFRQALFKVRRTRNGEFFFVGPKC